jgi:hypothetical protein
VLDVEAFMVSPEREQALETGQLWDEDSYLSAARQRLPAAQAAFVEQLLDDVNARGIRPGWGRRGSPNVSGHYLVAGTDTPVWVMNISKASLELRLLYVANSLKKAGHDNARLEKAAQLLSGIATDKFEAASKKEWKGAVFLPLSELVPDHAQQVIAAMDVLVDQQDPLQAT